MEPYYSDKGITIYLGDCREVLPSLPKIDLVLTDPPYSSGARRDADKQVRGSMLRGLEDEDWFSHDTMTAWGFSWFIRSLFSELKSHLTVGAHLYMFSDWRQTPNVYGMLESCGYRVNHCLVWDKEHFGMGAYWRNQHECIVFASLGMPAPMLDRGMGSVLRCKTVSSVMREHPTEKPVRLLAEIIAAVPGDIVLDPFMGSGATLQAAKRHGRRAIGIDTSEQYCELAAKRLELPFEEALQAADVDDYGPLFA